MKPVRLWIGAVLLALGVLGILDATDLLNAGSTIDRWWPLAVIGLGVVAMLTQGRVSFGAGIITVFGLALLAETLNLVENSIIGPAALLLIGLAVLISLFHHRTTGHREGSQPMAVFGSAKAKDNSEHLRHTDVSAIFGGATLDLRNAHIDTEATVDAFALFGGVQVVVPEGWRIEMSGLPILGGYEDKTGSNGSLPEQAPVLAVNATAIFGGVEVNREPH